MTGETSWDPCQNAVQQLWLLGFVHTRTLAGGSPMSLLREPSLLSSRTFFHGPCQFQSGLLYLPPTCPNGDYDIYLHSILKKRLWPGESSQETFWQERWTGSTKWIWWSATGIATEYHRTDSVTRGDSETSDVSTEALMFFFEGLSLNTDEGTLATGGLATWTAGCF